MKKIIFILFLALFSCVEKDQHTRINCVYKGGVILKNYGFKAAHLDDETYAIQYHGQVIEFVTVYDIDAGLQAGDTIKGNCLTN